MKRGTKKEREREREREWCQVSKILKELKNNSVRDVSSSENNTATKNFRMKGTIFNLSNRTLPGFEIKILEKVKILPLSKVNSMNLNFDNTLRITAGL